MTPERWRQIEELFEAAQPLPEPERAAMLASTDPAVAAEVRRMLTAPTQWMEQPPLPLTSFAKPMAVGDTLGPYRLDFALGRGGMGEVFLATDTRLGRQVAVKLMPPEFLSLPAYRERFRQEARAASALSHPNIVIVHDIASAGDTEFLVMEFASGRSLKDMIPRLGLPLDKVIRYGTQIASALAAAHAAGIVHRDIKPSNIMITSADQVKVLDFGIAKFVNPTAAVVKTVTGLLLGTEAYMAPEQRRGEQVDFRADLFSFGCLLYEAATGRHPFRSPTATRFRKPSHYRPELAGAFDELIAQCLSQDPGERPANAESIAGALAYLSEPQEAVSAAAGEARALDPMHASWMWFGIGVAQLTSEPAAAIASLERALAASAANQLAYWALAAAHHRAGNLVQAADLAAALPPALRCPAGAAIYYAATGESDLMFQALTTAARQRDPHFAALRHYPVFAPHRTDARFHVLFSAGR